MFLSTLFFLRLAAIIGTALAAEWSYDVDTLVSNSELRIYHHAGLVNLNSHFKLEVEATSIIESYPRSFAPLFFTTNPQSGGQRGFSIGHGNSKTTLQMRMGDGSGSTAVATFRYPAPLVPGTRNVFEITCAKTTSYRICSVAVNGRQANPPSARFNIRGNIYANNGGVWGNVWGWRFIGHLHQIRVQPVPGPTCVHYGAAVVGTSNFDFNTRSVLSFHCPTTTVTSTTQTFTTNTVGQLIQRHHGTLDDTADLIEGQISTANARASTMEARMIASEADASQLRAMLARLAAPSGLDQPEPDDHSAHVPCGAVDTDTDPNPKITTDDGSVEITACGGDINFHSQFCDFNPCAVQQKLNEIDAKLTALGVALGQ